MAMSHATCGHERTPAARRACRQRQHDASIEGMTPIVRQDVVVDYVVTPDLIADLATPAGRRKATREAARASRALLASADRAEARIARRAAKDPSVKMTNRRKSCVQAELHVGGGRCACGWQAKGCACGNPLVNAGISGPNAGGMCGPTYCHYALAN